MIDISIDRLKTSLKVLPIVQYRPPKGIRTWPSGVLNPVTESRSKQPVNLYALGAIVVRTLRETPVLFQGEMDSPRLHQPEIGLWYHAGARFFFLFTQTKGRYLTLGFVLEVFK